jgi:UDP-N-acetylglucosamine--N-acetylmuramyl-(pentapeptide) pyrophosphoryl-undecaprenol N-acetylglucosamine transferase
VRCTGCPIRPVFETARRDEGIERLKLDPAKKTLLVTGASQGAQSINLALVELVDDLRKMADWQIVHLTGAADLQRCREAYSSAGIDSRTIDFTENMHGCMAAADLIVSRAGASRR